MIGEAERASLLHTARAVIAASLGVEQPPSPDAVVASGMKAGAFVTLHLHGVLRGCIGHIEADQEIGAVVARCAVSAARDDPRFPPVSRPELSQLTIEISVLGHFELVRTVDDVCVGTHGLLVESGRRRGLLLPQVATAWGWDAREFVTQVCRKASVPLDAWPGEGVSLYRFTAEVFSEPAVL